MVKFEKVDPDEVMSMMRQPRRGRVSYPILKGFLETGMFMAKLDRTGMQQSLQSLTSTLSAYIRSHELPIKIFQRSGELYLMRLDMTPEGEPIPDWNEPDEEEADPITPEEVARRFQEEKDKTTK